MVRLVLFLFAVSLGNGALGDLLWDNDILPRRTAFRAISPPRFPDIRLVDDIVVSDPGWLITGYAYNAVEDDAWVHSGRSEVYIYALRDGVPGKLLLSAIGPDTRTPTGNSYFGRAHYIYRVSGLQIRLDPGTYLIGARDPFAAGEGSNYLGSSYGGPDGGCPPEFPDGSCYVGWISLDAGLTWQREGRDRGHYGFEVHGTVVPEPSSLALVGGGLGFLVRRKRRRGKET